MKNKTIYEIYSLDGNTDFLTQDDSDLSTVIRKGMWALMPQGVGDGGDNIDENFVSFIINRDKYPNKPISNISYLSEQFHECLNNLRTIFEKVDDPKKFYRNLLSLQEYLIENNLYDRDELILVEDGSTKFSTINSVGNDDYPVYDNEELEEDLEYNHVDDATEDVYELTERILHWIKGSKGVDVKKKCRLAGKGNTSDACNQGDINNLEFRNLNEKP